MLAIFATTGTEAVATDQHRRNPARRSRNQGRKPQINTDFHR